MSKEMKLIMENWRQSVFEAETKVDDIENPKGVAQLIAAIQANKINPDKLADILSQDTSVKSAIDDIASLIKQNPEQEDQITENILNFLKNVAINPAQAISGTPLGDKILKYAPATLALAFIALKLGSEGPKGLVDPDLMKMLSGIIKANNVTDELVTAAIETLEESK